MAHAGATLILSQVSFSTEAGMTSCRLDFLSSGSWAWICNLWEIFACISAVCRARYLVFQRNSINRKLSACRIPAGTMTTIDREHGPGRTGCLDSFIQPKSSPCPRSQPAFPVFLLPAYSSTLANLLFMSSLLCFCVRCLSCLGSSRLCSFSWSFSMQFLCTPASPYPSWGREKENC